MKTAVIAMACVAIGMLVGVAFSGPHQTPEKVLVQQYNDGFYDAKADDCDQGVTVACQWLWDLRK